MFECSIYGLLRRKFNWKGEKFRRIEKIYKSNTKTAIVCMDGLSTQDVNITIRETPDRNKQRSSIVTKITKLSVPSKLNTEDRPEDLFLTTLGYSYAATNILEGFRYLRNGYQIELTRLVEDEEIVDSSEEANYDKKRSEIPPSFYKYYLVKVFVETENIIEGEMLLENAFHELIGIIKLVKPDISVF